MSSVSKSELFRELPAVDDLLRRSDIAALAAQHGLALVTDACRATLADLRREIGAGRIESRTLQLALEGLTGAIESRLRHATASSLRSLINATGVILHTNLGRAPLSPSVLEFVAARSEEHTSELQSRRD